MKSQTQSQNYCQTLYQTFIQRFSHNQTDLDTINTYLNPENTIPKLLLTILFIYNRNPDNYNDLCETIQELKQNGIQFNQIDILYETFDEQTVYSHLKISSQYYKLFELICPDDKYIIKRLEKEIIDQNISYQYANTALERYGIDKFVQQISVLHKRLTERFVQHIQDNNLLSENIIKQLYYFSIEIISNILDINSWFQMYVERFMNGLRYFLPYYKIQYQYIIINFFLNTYSNSLKEQKDPNIQQYTLKDIFETFGREYLLNSMKSFSKEQYEKFFKNLTTEDKETYKNEVLLKYIKNRRIKRFQKVVIDTMCHPNLGFVAQKNIDELNIKRQRIC